MCKHYVYALRSLVDQQFYVGLTNDLVARLRMHNAGLVNSTKLRAPVELVYWEGCLNRSDAAQQRSISKPRGKSVISKHDSGAISRGEGYRFWLRPHHRSGRQRSA